MIKSHTQIINYVKKYLYKNVSIRDADIKAIQKALSIQQDEISSEIDEMDVNTIWRRFYNKYREDAKTLVDYDMIPNSEIPSKEICLGFLEFVVKEYKKELKQNIINNPLSNIQNRKSEKVVPSQDKIEDTPRGSNKQNIKQKSGGGE